VHLWFVGVNNSSVYTFRADRLFRVIKPRCPTLVLGNSYWSSWNECRCMARTAELANHWSSSCSATSIGELVKRIFTSGTRVPEEVGGSN
jgi:hypothetical protein